jgi:uncharacterized MnhB-related membrane protein
MMSSASTLSSMAQQFFMSLGITVAALVLHYSLSLHGSKMLTVHDFTPAFLITGILSLLAALTYVVLEPDAGEVVSGRRASIMDSSPTAPAEAVPVD